ncbi:MAG: cystathionine beta-synthase [Chloroflexi bacterium]|nr:MAG: cystathionine beta-synthase [Chloroflexota bacterium]
MRYLESILDAVGDTPLVRLHRVAAGLRPLVLAKVESLNPGGSIKDRIGLAMIEDAERRGLLEAGGTIVEPTSGNTGHGLAIAAALKGYRCVFVMPDKMSQEKISLLRAYGSEVVVCPTNVPRESAQSYYSVADRLTREIPGAFQPNQYANPTNPETHRRTTGPEIWEQTGGRISHLVAGMGTGGTISGIGRYLKEQSPTLQIIGADPVGSIYSGEIAPYVVEGVGEDFMPATMDMSIVDRVVQVNDRQSFVAARRLAREEGILVGGSSGLALHAALTVAAELEEGAVVVVILPDTGRNYLSKFFNDEWMVQNGYVDRISPARVREVLRGPSNGHHAGHDDEVPGLITVDSESLLSDAIELMQRYSISQLPVRAGAEVEGAVLVGSLQERTLLDHIYRDPGIVARPVAAAMDPPFGTVAADTPVDEAFRMLLRGDTAIVVLEGGTPIGMVTRADLLEFVAHPRG